MVLSFVDSWPMPLQLLAFVVALVVGIIFLVKFCDIFVAASSAIAKKLHISPLIIGLTIVAMGTSCPELAVSVSDSITTLINGGNANVAIGNVEVANSKTKVSDCAKKMKTLNIEQIPVIGVEGDLVGIVRASDLIKALVE